MVPATERGNAALSFAAGIVDNDFPVTFLAGKLPSSLYSLRLGIDPCTGLRYARDEHLPTPFGMQPHPSSTHCRPPRTQRLPTESDPSP